ncbi:hypothetical protein [Streptomyces sp. NPDC093676]|uniref:hypothetical protein n=1 Tax=Streptomyces sp. NPDC093676 TaxID=3366050 RepID=UPI00380A874A
MNVCGLCEQQLEHGHLCPGCTRATSQRLDRMPRMYEALAAFLRPGNRGGDGIRVQRVEAPMPIAEPAFILRGPGGMVSVLEDWRSAMQEDRGWGQPSITGDTARRITVAARALSINLEWIAGDWPMAGEFAAEIRTLEASVLSIVDPEDPDERRQRRGTRIGYCITPLPDEQVCGAVLRSFPGEAMLTCAWCLAAYGPKDYMRLKELQPSAA